MASSVEANVQVILNSFKVIFQKSLEFYAQKFVNTKTGTDTLSNSDILKNLKVDVQDERLVITVAEYYKWIESGRKIGAKGVPISVLIDFIKRKKIKAYNNISINQLAFLIQRSIKNKGISKRPIFTSAYNQALKEMEVQLQLKISDLIDNILIKTINK